MKKEIQVHPMAVVEEGAKLGKNVTVEAFAVVKSTVTLDDDVTIKSHAYIDGNTHIGKGSVIYPFASIGAKPQDLKFKGEKTFVKIGKYTEIREYVTINSSCVEGSTVEVGDHCLIMAYCHVAHNCIVGNHVIMSNNATLAGHVIVEDHAIIGGMTPIHQFSRVGTYAFVGGMSRVTHDIPPYTIGAGIPYKFGGLNLVGLKRHGFPLEARIDLSKAFKILYRSGLPISIAIKKIKEEVPPSKEVNHFVAFCENSKRGLMGLQDLLQSDAEADHFEEEPLNAISDARK